MDTLLYIGWYVVLFVWLFVFGGYMREPSADFWWNLSGGSWWGLGGHLVTYLAPILLWVAIGILFFA